MIYLNQRKGNNLLLKVVGGPFDGQYKFVPENFRIGVTFRIQEEFKLNPMSFPKTEDERVLGCSINYYNYRICVFNFNKDEAYRFLVIENMSDKEAIIHQFSK